MKRFYRFLSLLFLLLTANAALAEGWPANYEGVMLQGFYWDSYTDTRWVNLKSQADELAESFDLIWIPNSGRSSGSPTMGYMPIYWFTNHNSSFGTESQLLDMIATFREHNVGIIADVVVNHRSGMSNWTNFPAEEWNGKTYQLGPEHICSTDEVANAAGQAKPTGAPDTGEDFNGARDLDHTNATVQDNVKNYCLCLLQKYGYVGFRLDMVKGYAGRFTKLYNQYAKPQFCVGEYWDGNYDAVAAWIEATGRESAAFDFPCKYAMNEAFTSNDLTKLVWKANGTTDQPAGMIHYGYPRLAVTFIDNHDTYRDGSKFNGNVLAANAFILASPGTPCVFLAHWKQYKSQIKKMIAARKAAGVSNTSTVNVLKTSRDCYMAEIQGSHHKLAVRIGSTSDVPSGYTSADLYCSGSGYAMWVKGVGSGGGGGDDPVGPDKLYVLGNLPGAHWNTSNGVAMVKNGNTFTAPKIVFETVTGETKCFFNLTTRLASSWDELNSSADRFGSNNEGDALALNSSAAMRQYYAGGDAADCKSWSIAPGTYDIVADLKEMRIYAKPAGSTGVEEVSVDDTEAPAEYYNLQGVRVENPGHGLYIMRRGSSVCKVRL